MDPSQYEKKKRQLEQDAGHVVEYIEKKNIQKQAEELLRKTIDRLRNISKSMVPKSSQEEITKKRLVEAEKWLKKHPVSYF